MMLGDRLKVLRITATISKLYYIKFYLQLYFYFEQNFTPGVWFQDDPVDGGKKNLSDSTVS